MKRTGSILRSIFDSTDDVWFFVAPDHSILFFNQKAYENGKILHQRELQAGDNILDYARDTKNNVDERFATNFCRALSGELVVDRQQIEYNSAVLWFQSKYVPVYENGTMTGVSIVVSDITREKMMELAQEEANAKIHSLLRKREDFMSIASHELKTPLTGIKSLIQILQRKSRTDQLPKYEELLSKANHQVDKLTLLINDLLDVTRIDAGKLYLNITWFNLKDVLEECIYMMQAGSSTHQIELLGSADIMIQGDQNRLEQVICNILSNAIKYSEPGTPIQIHVAVNSGWVMITFRDEGIGIPEDKISKIFNRFYRIDEANLLKSGLGLGLYISNKIVQQHGGHIKLSSKLGEGTEFAVHLPALRNAAMN